MTSKLAPVSDPAIVHPLEQFIRWHQLSRLRAKSASRHDTQGPVHAAKGGDHRVAAVPAVSRATGSDAQGLRPERRRRLAGQRTHHSSHDQDLRALGREQRSGHRSEHCSPAGAQPPAPQSERLTWLRACLTEEADTLPYRVAGVLLLLYAQPLVRVAALRTDHVATTPQGLSMHFGGDPVPLPEPFAELMRTHLANRPNMRTANSAGSTWLFPGTRAGRQLHPNTLMTRLRQLGINPLGARNAALRELLQQAPAPSSPSFSATAPRSPSLTLPEPASPTTAIPDAGTHRERPHSPCHQGHVVPQ